MHPTVFSMSLDIMVESLEKIEGIDGTMLPGPGEE